MRLIKLFLFLLPSVITGQPDTRHDAKSSFLVCYGRLDPASVKGYRLVILEAAHYKAHEIRLMKKNNDCVLAYISLGEVNEHARHFDKFKNNISGKNTTWNSHYLDLTKTSTTKLLLDMMAAEYEKGFDGFFLDNLDNFGSFGPQKEQKQHLFDLLSQMRNQWPEKQLVQNAGLEMITETAALVNGVIVESVATDYSFEHRMYRLRKPDSAFESYARRLQEVAKMHQLPVYVIEYAHSQKLKQQVKERLAPFQLEYFIANIDLQTLPKFKP